MTLFEEEIKMFSCSNIYLVANGISIRMPLIYAVNKNSSFYEHTFVASNLRLIAV